MKIVKVIGETNCNGDQLIIKIGESDYLEMVHCGNDRMYKLSQEIDIRIVEKMNDDGIQLDSPDDIREYLADVHGLDVDVEYCEHWEEVCDQPILWDTYKWIIGNLNDYETYETYELYHHWNGSNWHYIPIEHIIDIPDTIEPEDTDMQYGNLYKFDGIWYLVEWDCYQGSYTTVQVLQDDDALIEYAKKENIDLDNVYLSDVHVCYMCAKNSPGPGKGCPLDCGNRVSDQCYYTQLLEACECEKEIGKCQKENKA